MGPLRNPELMNIDKIHVGYVLNEYMSTSYDKQISTRVMPVWRSSGGPLDRHYRNTVGITQNMGSVREMSPEQKKLMKMLNPDRQAVQPSLQSKMKERQTSIDQAEGILRDARFRTTSLARPDSQWPGSVDNYLFLYVVGNSTDHLFGVEDDDVVHNIPHFYVGSDKGSVKNIEFSRTKIKYKLESYLSKQSGVAQANLLFADRYDANMTILGNPAFKPGSLFYINPRALGLGQTADVNWRSSLGIGGYFRVVKVKHSLTNEKFETQVEGISEYSVREIPKKPKNVSNK